MMTITPIPSQDAPEEREQVLNAVRHTNQLILAAIAVALQDSGYYAGWRRLQGERPHLVTDAAERQLLWAEEAALRLLQRGFGRTEP